MINSQEAQADNVAHSNIAEADDLGKIDKSNANEDNEAEDAVDNMEMFYVDRLRRTVSTFTSQLPADNQKMGSKGLFLQCVDKEEMQHIPIPTISHELLMQRRYEAVRATFEHVKRPMPMPENQCTQYYTNSSDDGPP
jgi:hypothetical protein